jgi:hypothetical protein
MRTNQRTKEAKGDFDFISGCHVTKLVNGYYYVYNDESEYSQSAIKVIKLGRCERDAIGNAVKFASVQDADNWVNGGKIIHPQVQFGIVKERS